MKIAAKITAGYGILIALTIGVLIYHVSLIQDLESVNRNLSGINFQAAMIALQLNRDLDHLEEYTEKFFVTGDPGYAAKLKDMQEAFTADLRKMKSLGRSEKEQVEIKRLSQMWDEFLKVAPPPDPAPQKLRPEEIENWLADLRNLLDQLRSQTDLLFQTNQDAMQSQVERSTAAGRQAERISWGAVAAALVLSFLVSFLIVRSISEPLDQLTEGTRAIAEGKFLYQLDASRNDEFSQLAHDFNTMVRRLNELDQMKKDFMSHVSHELKAPLASMQETIQLMVEQIPGPLTEKQKRLLELNLQSGKRLFSMISNLLDLSRMEAGVMDYELKKQDLIALIRIVLAEFETRAQEKDLHIEADLPPEPLVVDCDGDRIIQVVGNLLENALKFSSNGAAVGVGVRFTSQIPWHAPEAWRQKVARIANGKGFVLMAVSDSGPGVPDTHKEKIFQKFHQVKQGRKISGQGVGLGLAICQTIVEAHNGAIWVEDNTDRGSVFFVLLPAEATDDSVTCRASASF
jgi:two-component system sensor histidine kinase GlrK